MRSRSRGPTTLTAPASQKQQHGQVGQAAPMEARAPNLPQPRRGGDASSSCEQTLRTSCTEVAHAPQQVAPLSSLSSPSLFRCVDDGGCAKGDDAGRRRIEEEKQRLLRLWSRDAASQLRVIRSPPEPHAALLTPPPPPPPSPLPPLPSQDGARQVSNSGERAAQRSAFLQLVEERRMREEGVEGDGESFQATAPPVAGARPHCSNNAFSAATIEAEAKAAAVAAARESAAGRGAVGDGVDRAAGLLQLQDGRVPVAHTQSSPLPAPPPSPPPRMTLRAAPPQFRAGYDGGGVEGNIAPLDRLLATAATERVMKAESVRLYDDHEWLPHGESAPPLRATVHEEDRRADVDDDEDNDAGVAAGPFRDVEEEAKEEARAHTRSASSNSDDSLLALLLTDRTGSDNNDGGHRRDSESSRLEKLCIVISVQSATPAVHEDSLPSEPVVCSACSTTFAGVNALWASQAMNFCAACGEALRPKP